MLKVMISYLAFVLVLGTLMGLSTSNAALVYPMAGGYFSAAVMFGAAYLNLLILSLNQPFLLMEKK